MQGTEKLNLKLNDLQKETNKTNNYGEDQIESINEQMNEEIMMCFHLKLFQ